MAHTELGWKMLNKMTEAITTSPRSKTTGMEGRC